MKASADKQAHATHVEWKPGDTFLVKQPKTSKLTSAYRACPYTVTHVKGTIILHEATQHTVKSSWQLNQQS